MPSAAGGNSRFALNRTRRSGASPCALAPRPLSARSGAATSDAGSQIGNSRSLLGRLGSLQGVQEVEAILAHRLGIGLACRPWPWAAATPRSAGHSARTTPAGSRPWSQSGATVATALSAARRVSATSSSRFSTRMAASTCVESVRCWPRALSQPRARQRSSSLSSRSSSALPASRRSRNSLSTEKSKPGSVSSRLSRYFQSMRARTASAAWRSARFSRNCMIVTNASRHGGKPGWPPRGKQGGKVLVLKDRPEGIPQESDRDGLWERRHGPHGRFLPAQAR